MSVRNESGRVAGKVAFITGAGQGQGRTHALALAAEGARIVGCDLDTPYPDCVNYAPANAELLAETRQLVEEAGGEMVTAVADVRRLDELRAAVAVGLEAFGRIDVVCANAGLATFPSSPFDVSEEEYDVVMDTNAKGCWNTVLATAPHMIGARRPGSIIMTSSAAGLRGHVPYAHYVAAKHAVVGLMRSFSNELARHGIRVNTVHPTGVASPGMGSDPNIFPLFESRPDFLQSVTNTMPDLDSSFADNPDTADFQWVPALAPEEISRAVVFLASDESRYITGQTLAVDAGCTTKA
ncbi:MAG TPA: mycofactocin-coupled SDR family oxidoreductase [Actinomycetales bacterium]|nr:mycofactocin-coupled SDR family oxidoreductase [Actinomycetales bacterium]